VAREAVGDDVLVLVEAHLVTAFGEPAGRASVTFLGSEPIDVLRFGPDDEGLVRYATVGMARRPMTDPLAEVVDPVGGPRGELVLSIRGSQDSVLRRLAVLASTPAVEGIVVVAGALLDVGEPLWDGAGFTAVLVGEPGGLLADLGLAPPREPVRFFPLLPMTPDEAAWKRARGAQAIEQLWLDQGVDLRDPARPSVLRPPRPLPP
jgi:hypothetical protein